MYEKAFKTKVLKKLKELGGWWYKTNDLNYSGIPDILGCNQKGKFVALELKVGYNKATPMQAFTLSQINNNQGQTYVVYPDNLNEVLKVLKK